MRGRDRDRELRNFNFNGSVNIENLKTVIEKEWLEQLEIQKRVFMEDKGKEYFQKDRIKNSFEFY